MRRDHHSAPPLIRVLASVAALASVGALRADVPAGFTIRIGEEVTTESEFASYLRNINSRLEFTSLPRAEQNRLVDRYVETRLLAREARALGLDREPEIAAEIEFFIERVLARARRQALEREVAVAEADIEAYYHDQLERFRSVPRYHIEHIVYREPESARSARRALEQGQDYRAVVGAGRAAGTIVINERHWLDETVLLPEIAAQINGLDPGELAEIFETSYGHHVLRLLDRKPARQLRLNEVRARIEDRLRRRHSAQRLESHLEGLRQRYGVVTTFDSGAG